MGCPFCSPKRENLLYEDELIRVILDEYPANRGGHVLVIPPRRHVETWEELDEKRKNRPNAGR